MDLLGANVPEILPIEYNVSSKPGIVTVTTLATLVAVTPSPVKFRVETLLVIVVPSSFTVISDPGPCGPCGPGTLLVPAGPCGPCGPCEPDPWGPCGPCGPSAPCGPELPVNPTGPGLPMGPWGPEGPCGP